MSLRDCLRNVATSAFLIALVALSWPALCQNEPTTSEHPTADRQAPQQAPQPLDVLTLRAIFDEAVKLYAAEKAENSASEDRKERREESDLFAQWQQSRWARWAAIFAGLTFIANAVAIGLVYATFWQTRRTADAAVDAALAAKDSLAAAVRSADAAEETLAVARKTSERQLRAYVFVDASEIRNFGTSVALEGWIRLKNTGLTPAYDLRRVGDIMFTTYPATSFRPCVLGDSKGFLGPGGEVDLGPIALPRALSQAEHAAVIAGKSAIYLFGNIEYRDAFGQTQTVSFRVLYHSNGRPPPSTTLVTIQDTEGNEAT